MLFWLCFERFYYDYGNNLLNVTKNKNTTKQSKNKQTKHPNKQTNKKQNKKQSKKHTKVGDIFNQRSKYDLKKNQTSNI